MTLAQADAERLSLDLERMVRALRALITDDPLSQSASAVLSRLDTDGPSGVTVLARAERVSQPAMTQLVGRLHADGLVNRGAADGDRRTVLVSLTDDGRTALENRRRIRAARVADALQSLDAMDGRALLAALPAFERLTAIMHDGFAGAGRRSRDD